METQGTWVRMTRNGARSLIGASRLLAGRRLVLGLLVALAGCAGGDVTNPGGGGGGDGSDPIPIGGGTTYFVSTTGSDSSDGLSPATAFRTLQHGADLLHAGDILNVAGGDYSQPDSSKSVVRLKRSGTASAWIAIQAMTGQHPRLICRNKSGVQLDSSTYILVQGLELAGNAAQLDSAWAVAQAGDPTNPLTNGTGFLIGGLGRYTHDIAIRYNTVHDFPGSGIATINSDYIRIQGNIVHDNALYSPKAGSGISTFQNWNSDEASGYHNRIMANRVYHNRNFVLNQATGTYTDGNGIIIDDARNTKNGATLGAYNGHTLIENNVVYENGGRGIHVYLSDHVDIVNNSTYHNTLQPRGTKGEITVVTGSDVRAMNNILVSPVGGRANQLYQSTAVTNDYNLVSDATHYDSPGAHDLLNTDPMYNGAPADLTLKAGSPAIDRGGVTLWAKTDFLGKARPVGAAVDQGAFEYGAP